MDPVTLGILGTGLLFFLLLIGLPIAFSLMLVGFLGVSCLTSLAAALPMMARTLYETSSQYAYTIIPLFIVMGVYAEMSGLSRDLYNTFDKWLRRWPGGLGMATIAAIAGFSAVSGSSVAASATMGKVAYPEMRRFHYSPRLAAGVVAAGATVDFLIPPALVLSSSGCSPSSRSASSSFQGSFPASSFPGRLWESCTAG